MYRFTLENTFLGKLPLKTPPVGWEDLSFEHARDKKYQGTSANISFDAEFVKEGKDYLKAAYERDGVVAKVTIRIEAYNTDIFEYEEFYVGRLKFIDPSYQEQGDKIICSIEQDGFARQFLNLDDVEVNLQKLESINGKPIPAFPNETETLQLHSREIVQSYEAFALEHPAVEVPTLETEPKYRSPTISFGFDDVKTNELDAFTYGTSFSFDDRINEILKASGKGPYFVSFRLKTTIKVILTAGNFETVEVWYRFRKNDDAPIDVAHHKQTNTNGSFYEEIDTSLKTFNLNLEIGDRIYIYGDITVSDVGNASYAFTYSMELHPDSFVKIVGHTTTPATPAKGVLIHEAFSRIIQSLSDNTVGFYSEFFGRTDSAPITYPADGPGSLLLQTNGFQIRNFPIAEKPIYASFRDLFDSMDALFNLGAGLEYINGKQVVRVEKKEHFFRNEVVLNLGCVPNLKISVAPEYYFNQAEFGYQQWQTEQDNGLNEYNSKRTLLLPLSSVKTKYTAISPYIGSGSILEETRRKQYVDTTTKDDQKDNLNFLICLLRKPGGGFETERNQQMQVLENVFSPATIYNVRISPARNIRRHGYMFRVPLFKMGTAKISFNKGEGNYKMRSMLNGEPDIIAENEDLDSGYLENPPYIPEYYEFESPFTPEQQKLINANPYGLVEFTDSKNITRKGFLISPKVKPTQGLAEFKLLRAFSE